MCRARPSCCSSGQRRLFGPAGPAARDARGGQPPMAEWPAQFASGGPWQGAARCRVPDLSCGPSPAHTGHRAAACRGVSKTQGALCDCYACFWKARGTSDRLRSGNPAGTGAGEIGPRSCLPGTQSNTQSQNENRGGLQGFRFSGNLLRMSSKLPSAPRLSPGSRCPKLCVRPLASEPRSDRRE